MQGHDLRREQDMLRFTDLSAIDLARINRQRVEELKRASMEVIKNTVSNMVKQEEWEQIGEYNKMLDYLDERGR